MLDKIDALERELAVHVGAPSLRANLGNEATAHDVALYQLQEALRAWRRWSAAMDDLQDDAAVLTDGSYAVRLMAEDVREIMNAQISSTATRACAPSRIWRQRRLTSALSTWGLAQAPKVAKSCSRERRASC